MSLKYCPVCGKVEERFPTKLLFVAMALSITAVILIACRRTLRLSYSTDDLLDFLGMALSVCSLGVIVVAVVLGFRLHKKICSCGAKYVSIPNYELIGVVLSWIGSFLIIDWHEDFRGSFACSTIFLAGILIFILAPVVKLATLKLYRELYPVPNSTLKKADTKVSLYKE